METEKKPQAEIKIVYVDDNISYTTTGNELLLLAMLDVVKYQVLKMVKETPTASDENMLDD